MADKRDTYDDNGSGFSKEFVIWITLLVSIILILCVFDLCGPLSGIFGAFLFGIFGFMAYIFPFLLFFSAGFYLMNKQQKSNRQNHCVMDTVYYYCFAVPAV